MLSLVGAGSRRSYAPPNTNPEHDPDPPGGQPMPLPRVVELPPRRYHACSTTTDHLRAA